MLYKCLVHAEPKLAILDPERADSLEPNISKLAAEAGTAEFLVFEAHEGKGQWRGMKAWDVALNDYKGDPQSILSDDPGIMPEDNATILFTLGKFQPLAQFSVLMNLQGRLAFPRVS